MQEPNPTRANERIATSATASSYNLMRMLIVVLFFIVVGFLLNKALRPAETPLTQAQALIRAGKAAAALPILEQQSLAHPENHGVFPLLAQGYLSTDRVAEGRIALDTALKMELPAKDLIPAVLSFASYYAHKGDFAEADKGSCFEPASTGGSARREPAQH